MNGTRWAALAVSLLMLFGCTQKDGGEEPVPEQTEPSANAGADVETVEGEDVDETPEYARAVLNLPGSDGELAVPVYEVEPDFFDGCTLIRPDEASQDLVWSAARFRSQLESDFGMKLGISSDWLEPGETVPADSREILVGGTNRPQSPDHTKLGRDDYIIRFENDRLILCGGSDEATAAAEQFFAEYLVSEKRICLPYGEGYLHTVAYVCDSLTVDGVELSDYALSPGLGALGDYLLSVTGRSPAGGSGKTLTLARAEDDTVFSVAANADGITLSYGKFGTPAKAVAGLISLLEEKGGIDRSASRQTVSLTASDLTARVTPDDLGLLEPKTLYVAPGGDDGAAGTETAPLGTLGGAQERVRELLMTSLAPVTVTFRGGDYFFDASVSFGEADSGTAGAPVSYRAYPGERVRFLGGKIVPRDLIAPAESADVLSRVNDAAAREALMQIDLSSLTEVIPDIYSYGHTVNNAKMPLEVYVDGSALTTARWPNRSEKNAYVYTAPDEVQTKSGSKIIFFGDDVASRAETWSDKSLEQLYLFGFLFAEWTNETYDASRFDRDARSITLRGGLDGYFSSIGSSKRVCFLNLPEEIDEPGECWIDREKLIVYFYPPENTENAEIAVSLLDEDMILLDGVSHLRFEDIELVYTRANAIRGAGAADITLSGCTAAHTSAKAFVFEDAARVCVENCEVYDTANGGISISGGDRTTLTSSECVVEGCEIHSVNRDNSTYGPGISAYGVGMEIRRNLLYDSVHEMIHVGTNDVLIEYNELFGCVKESSDMGAIYFGRSPTVLSTVIRYNYFHDMGNEYGGIGQFSVYLDDGNMGAEIYGNLFVNAAGREEAGSRGSQAAIMHHGVQFSHIYNNIFVDTSTAFRFVDWKGANGDAQTGWILWLFDRDPKRLHESVQRMREVDFDSDLWRAHYAGTIWANLYDYASSEKIAEYSAMSDRDMQKTAAAVAPSNTNEFDNNLLVGVQTPTSGGSSNKHDNTILTSKDIFRDPENGDWTLTEEGLEKVRAGCPEFTPLPFSGMGRSARNEG
ncbi:MAG: right-handed parallel beta-helix repeat-containing protein [Clostridia bacterium]|nr:right-handed parallel beta-helix repeat-containing protein [Clostridia bacterium]